MSRFIVLIGDLALGKYLVVIIFIGILVSLGSALFHLVRERGNSKRTVKALTVRIGLSVALFILLFILFAAGLIDPHGIQPG